MSSSGEVATLDRPGTVNMQCSVCVSKLTVADLPWGSILLFGGSTCCLQSSGWGYWYSSRECEGRTREGDNTV